MNTVQNILETKGGEAWSVSPGTSVYDAVAMMSDKGCGALLVMNGDELVGIISERDYARKVILADRSSKSTLVSEIMSTPVLTAKPPDAIEQCLSVMTDNRIRHLPIVDGAKVVGMVSIGDLVKTIIAKQEFLIAQLEQYIKQ